jgi:hypothetical protein
MKLLANFVVKSGHCGHKLIPRSRTAIAVRMKTIDINSEFIVFELVEMKQSLVNLVVIDVKLSRKDYGSILITIIGKG